VTPHLVQVVEYTIYVGLVVTLLFAMGVLIGNADELVRELIDNLAAGVAHVAVR
jgi:hypothetical protein